MTRLLFIRHGATAGNLQRRYIGRTDQPLCPEGIAQAKALTALSLAPDRVFCSPLLRTRQTAQLAFPELEPEIVPGFTETDFGPWEGKTADELADCAAYRDWVDGFCQGPIPGGEDPAAFKARCRQAFLEIVPRLPADGCAAFVVHGGVIMAILEAFARPRGSFYDFHLSNGGHLAGYWQSPDAILLDRP